MSIRSKNSHGNTFHPTSKIKRVRKFGFRARSTQEIKRKRAKGRKALSASIEFGSKVEKNKKFSRRK